MSASALDVLLVEDNPGDVRIIEELLSEAADGSGTTATGELRHASRLSEGLERLETERVDAVLLDLGLPDSSGLETLETVLERTDRVPVVVLTGLDDETVGVRAVKQGAQEYLVKDELTPTLLGRSLRHAVERKKFERTQAALHDATRDLIQTGSSGEVSQLAVDAGVDVLDLRGVAVYLFDGATNELEPAAYTDYVASEFGEVPSFGPGDNSITWRAFIDGETVAIDDIDESDSDARDEVPFQSGLWIPLGDHGVFCLMSETAGGFDPQTQRLADHLAATVEAALDRVEREASLREHERELTAQNRRLESLNRTNELVREIDQALVEATTRDAVERAVCDRLTRDGRFAFAWIGDVADGERLRPRTRAGTDRGYLDSVSLSLDAPDPPPAVETAATDEATLVPNVASDLRGAPWRKAALSSDLQSVVSVPITYNDISYGVLSVLASEPDALDDSAGKLFAELGETIGNAINAAETRQALLTDTVVELELAIRDPDDVLVRIGREADCRIEYGGAVPQSDGTTRVYFQAGGAPLDAVRDVADGVASVQRVEVITEGDDEDGESRFEMTVSGPTVPSTLVECGAIARSIEVGESTIRAVVELPDTTDVRTFLDRLEGTYPDTDLIARRDRERSDDSRQSLERALPDRLTDRQLEILRTAYLSGYFEWPRERTGEEVAESLGITQPTFNGHLRSAERKLCDLLFEGA